MAVKLCTLTDRVSEKPNVNLKDSYTFETQAPSGRVVGFLWAAKYLSPEHLKRFLRWRRLKEDTKVPP
jgi:hypothetical protein